MIGAKHSKSAFEAANALGHDWGEAPQVGVQNIFRKLEKFRPAPPDEVVFSLECSEG
jgi:hypothetical protein